MCPVSVVWTLSKKDSHYSEEHFGCGQETDVLVLRSPEEEAMEEDSGSSLFQNGASSGGANGFTSKESSTAVP